MAGLGTAPSLASETLEHSAASQLLLCPGVDWAFFFLIAQKNFIAVSAANRFKKISSSGALMALGV
jgi:hypothetical protein